MVVLLLRIHLPFLGRNLFYILVLLFELSLGIVLAYTCLVLVMLYLFRRLCPQVGIVLAYTCLVLVMLYLFRRLCPQVDCLVPLGF